MKISDLIKLLEFESQKHGDVEVTIQATTLREGFSVFGNNATPDVFESTVESARINNSDSLGKTLRLYWQC